MSRAICTLAHGPHRALLDVTRPVLEHYARAHGYELVVAEQRLAPHRPASWDTVLLVHDLLRRHELVMWIDADALVVDEARDVADELVPGRFLHVVEHRLAHGRVPNFGVFAVRRGALARRFLRRVWHQRQFVHHQWWENAAVLHLLGYRVEPPVRPARPSVWRAGVGFLDGAWNSIPDDPAPDPVIVHSRGSRSPTASLACAR